MKNLENLCIDQLDNKNVIPKQYMPDKTKLPSKLKHIKNNTFLNNSFDPMTGKYVKKIWTHKKTKLDRWKRDMIWEYFRHRKKKTVTDALRETFYKNVKIVTIIYFDDPIQHKIEITQPIVDLYLNIKIFRSQYNSINPLNGKYARRIWYQRKIKQGIKNKRFWDYKENGESTAVRDIIIQLWHQNTRNIVILYEDNSTETFYLTENMFYKAKKYLIYGELDVVSNNIK